MIRLGAVCACGIYKQKVRTVNVCPHCDRPCLVPVIRCRFCLQLGLNKQET